MQFYEYVNGNGSDAPILPPDIIHDNAPVYRYFYHNLYVDCACFVSSLTETYFRPNGGPIALGFLPH